MPIGNMRVTTLLAALTLGLGAAGTRTAQSADWKPTKPIEIVAPGSAGGGYDRQARVLQRILQERKLIDVPVNVVNKPGGSSALGWLHLTQQSGEPHVIAVASTTYLTNDVLGIHSFRHTDLVPLALMATEYLVFSVRGDSALRSGRDLAQSLRQNVRGVSFATAPGPGNANHIVLGMVARPLGVDVKQIPFVFFKSAGESATALLGGHVQVVIGSIPPVLEHTRAGKLRMLAIAAPQRLGGDMQDVPTWKEQGIDAEFRNWRGVLGPKGLTREQTAWWEGVLLAVTRSEEWNRDVERVHATTAFVGSAEATRQLAAQQREIAQTLRELGIAK